PILQAADPDGEWSLLCRGTAETFSGDSTIVARSSRADGTHKEIPIGTSRSPEAPPSPLDR
ncbi:MAG: hypothetical protein M3518_01150, partial [Actinomycetota bacterium]|nr:hypothetical protein [Actinomycetota bacterium]